MDKIENITLVPGEKVKLRIKRAWIGVIMIWAALGAGAALLLFASTMTMTELQPACPMCDGGKFVDVPVFGEFRHIIWAIVAFMAISGLVLTYVYRQNELIITNKRAIQKTVVSPFGQSINTIDLSMIEDVSLKRDGVWQFIFRVGTIRMSTVGDETTYTFKFVDTPEDEIDTIMQLVHAEQNETKKVAKKKSS